MKIFIMNVAIVGTKYLELSLAILLTQRNDVLAADVVTTNG